MEGLRITIGDVVLTPTAERELDQLAALLPADVELDPTVVEPSLAADPGRRALAFHQVWWRARSAWTPAAWACPFTVVRAGRTVGVQWLESHAWRERREVDSSSWLVPWERGRGTGLAMRRGVLALAFGPLAATAAVSSAWEENAASLAVSRRLGYRVTHTEPHLHGARSGLLVHVRLDAAEWDAAHHAEEVVLDVADGVLPRFG